MTGRELAWRVFASELLASSAEERGTGEKSPSYVISPLGARMNRVLLPGMVSPMEGGGGNATGGFVRSRLSDATGTVPVTAGSYQPQGQSDLAKISQPTRALVIGKAALSRGVGAAPSCSVRVEAVQPLPDVDFRTLTAETAVQTLERLQLVLQLRSPAPPSDAELARAGVSPSWVRGARSSIARYPALDTTPYYGSLRAVFIALGGPPVAEPSPITGSRPPGSQADVIRSVRSPKLPKAPTSPPGMQGLEGRLLEILDELSDKSPDGYADMDELAERAARHGLDGERMEELLNYLSENGTLEEPLVGKFRRAEGPPRE